MKRQLILTLLLTTILQSCNTQTEEEKRRLEQQTSIAIKKWLENPTISNDVLDNAAIKQPQDSGRFENNLKEGLWNEYSLDTTLMGYKTEVIVGEVKIPMSLSATLIKASGNYLKGKKEGVWIVYKSYDKKSPFYWNIDAVTSYNNGLKNGEEIIYKGFGVEDQKPLLIRHWKNGIENGIGKIYNANYPNNLEKVYNAINGQMWLMETYYTGGQLQTKFNDTIINGENCKYFKEFYESGKLKATGFYLNGESQTGTWTDFYENGKTERITNYSNGKLSGAYKYFHDNGQLWTERTYKEGKLFEVKSNYNKNGKKNNPGTVKNGNGKLNIYDADGKLIEVVEYVDGQEKKVSR